MRRLSDDLDTPFEIVKATSVEDVEGSLARVAESTESVHGEVDCVGSLLLKPAHLTTPDEWSDTIGTNLTSSLVAWLLREENNWNTGQLFGVAGRRGTIRANGR